MSFSSPVIYLLITTHINLCTHTKCPVLEKMFPPLTKHDFSCALNFPTKFMDVSCTTFYGFNAHRRNIKYAYCSLYNEKPLLHIN